MIYLLFPTLAIANNEGLQQEKSNVVPDTIMKNIFTFSSSYSKIIDEYKADLYVKGLLKVHKMNHLIRYIPSMFTLKKDTKDYILESFSELHYTSPNIYDRKIIAVSSTFRKNKGELMDMMDFLNMNIYSSSLMTDKLLSPLDKKSSKYYNYVIDAIYNDAGCIKYRIKISPKFYGTQLVKGYVIVSDNVWTIREIYIEGKYNLLTFKVKTFMGEEDSEEDILPVRFNLDVDFDFIGNHLSMNCDATLKYKNINVNDGTEKRRYKKKHHHDLSESYQLKCDTTNIIMDKEFFNNIRPYELNNYEKSIYVAAEAQQDSIKQNKVVKHKKIEFWGQLGDMLISSYNVNLSGVGSVKCSPLINPVMFSYSHSNGYSYKQKFKYNRLFQDGKLLRIVPQIGYNFTRKELYAKVDAEMMYWPSKQGTFGINVGNGNRIYSSVVLDQLKQFPDSTFDFSKVELDYFKDVHLNMYHRLEVVNGLFIEAGLGVHWRYLINKSKLVLEKPITDKEWATLRGIKRMYNSFAPRLKVEWTPGMYYYMNGNRKMNVGSEMPTFMIEYERGIKGILGSTGSHERWEFDIQQKIKLNGIKSIAYRVGGGIFTEQKDVYFVDFANFSRRNLPDGWNDDIGGTFQLLAGEWYNSSRQYWRGNMTYESPFILLKPINKLLRKIQHERIYAGILFMPHLNPYIEIGYGIGTHVFDFGIFVSTINEKYNNFGCKFTFELFNK